MKRIHIIGPPRSGTTLMLELMAAGFEFSAVSKHEVSLLDLPAEVPADGTVCTKNPQDHRLVGALIDRDPNQWFISLVRDPRDVICSRHGLRPDVYWANLRQWRTWLDNTRAFRHHPRLIEVRYEELVEQPNAVQRQIAGRLPFLRLRLAFSEFHNVASPSNQSVTAMKGVRPVSKRSVGQWRRNLPRVAGQIRIHGPMSQELIELAYEADDRWLGLIEGVVPDTRPGHWPEFVAQELAEKYRVHQQEKLQAYLQARGL